MTTMANTTKTRSGWAIPTSSAWMTAKARKPMYPSNPENSISPGRRAAGWMRRFSVGGGGAVSGAPGDRRPTRAAASAAAPAAIQTASVPHWSRSQPPVTGPMSSVP